MTSLHRALLTLSCIVIFSELALTLLYRELIVDWLSHNLWVVVVPFAKVIIKRLLAMKLVMFFKALGMLVFNLLKLLLLKLFKTLSIRYGVFFSQNRWRWIRYAKVMFLRRGKQFFRSAARFWNVYSPRNKWIILVAFFPAVLLLFLLGLSFNVTRKTMVQKTQETAVFQMAASAGTSSRGVRAWITKLDRRTLEKIRQLTPRAKGSSKFYRSD